MDKTLLKAYIRTIVEEEVKRVLPDILGEAIAEIKGMQQVNEVAQSPAKPKLDRSRLAAMMGLERMGDTLSATTGRMQTTAAPTEIPANLSPDDPAVQAVTRDYSAMMKKMGLSK